MVSMNTQQKFQIALNPVMADGVTPGSVDAPPTYPVDTAGIVTLQPSADGFTCEVLGATAGTCTITPTATAGGQTITGDPIQVTVSVPPPPPATQLLETIGPVVSQ